MQDTFNDCLEHLWRVHRALEQRASSDQYPDLSDGAAIAFQRHAVGNAIYAIESAMHDYERRLTKRAAASDLSTER